MSSSKPIRPSSRGSAEEAKSVGSSTSVTTAVPPTFQASPFADTSEPNSYSEVSVRSECDDINFRNNNTSLASADTSKNITTHRIKELEKKRIEGPLFDAQNSDFVKFHTEPLQFCPNAPGSKLLWHTHSDVCEVMMHGRQPSFEKHSERVVPNPWRRFGTLTKLMSVGGWSNKRKKSVCFEVKAGTPIPNAPNAPQMMLHRDPKRPIPFTYPPKNVSSEMCAQNFALQIALRVENSWMSKSWFNPKRLHFMDPQHHQRSMAASSSKRQEVHTFPTNSRSRLSSASGSISGVSDCSTAVSGRFSNSSVSSTSTATPNVRKQPKKNK